MGPHAVRVAAELADGWFPAWVPRDGFAARVPDLQRLRAAGERAGRPLTVVSGPFVACDIDEAAARAVAASCTAWYLCAMGDVYARALSEHGYPDEVAAIRAANPRPHPQKGVVPAEAQVVLDQLTLYGSPARIQEGLARWDEAVDLVTVGLPPGVPWESIEATLRAGAP